MNHFVPDFEIQMDDDEDYPIPISSRPKKPSMQNDEIMELLWQNGQVVMQSQNQRPLRKLPPPARNTDGEIPARSLSAREARSSEAEESYHNQHLFMQEDETASWVHYSIHEDPPFDHQNFCADILYPPPNQNHNAAMKTAVRAAEIRQPPIPAPPRPPIPPARRIQNFAHFSKHNNVRAEQVPASSSKAAVARESTVVNSCETPVSTATAAVGSRVSETVRRSTENAETGCGSMTAAGKAAASADGRETATSSPGGSSGSAEPGQREPAVDRKRKGRERRNRTFRARTLILNLRK